MSPWRLHRRVSGLISCLVVAVAAVTVTSACGSVDQSGIEIQATPYIKPVYEQISQAFTAAHPGAAVRVRIGPREEDQMVQQLLRTHLVGGALPDAVFVSGNLVRILAERKLAVPLDPFIASDPEWNEATFAPAVTAAGHVDGKTYGVAFGFSLPVVLFNSELARRAGADPKALPSSWDEIVSLARRIDDPKSAVVGGFIEYDNGGAFSFLFLLESHGGQLLTGDEQDVAFDDARGLQALSVLRDFGAAGQARADMTRDQARQAFGAGGIGILVTMSSMLARLEQASAQRFEVLSMPLPIEAAGGRLPAAGPIAVMLTRDPARQRLVFELMKLACGPAGQEILAAQSGYAPVNTAAIRASPDLRTTLAARRNAHAYLERLNATTEWYSPPGPNSTRITDIVVTHLQQVVTLQAAPSAALQAMADDVKSLLPR